MRLVCAKAAAADEKVAEIRKRLDAFPETPDDTVLTGGTSWSKMPTSYSYVPGGSENTPLSVPG